MWENSVTLSIDLNAKEETGQTAFHLACGWDHFYLVKVIMENSDTVSIDLNAKDNRGHTAFNLACILDCPSIMELMLNTIDSKLKIDLEIERSQNREFGYFIRDKMAQFMIGGY